MRRSLGRALRGRGHTVLETPPVWTGHNLPQRKQDIETISAALADAIAFKPDLILCFRAATLTPQMLLEARKSGVRTAVWLPDDPVLYAICYSKIVDHYDIVLNCGSTDVLEFYSKKHGLQGVNFPFWTDTVEFPQTRGTSRDADYDVAFLGSLVGPVRRRRYNVVAGLPGHVRIYGRVDSDPHKLVKGYLHSESEIAGALGKSKIGFNIPQFFRDYAGHKYDFPGLARFRSFEFPSRVIQYASIGLPVLTYGLSRPPDTFPEMLVAVEKAKIYEMCRDALARPDELDDIAARTHQRFLAAFTAARRAQFLEAIVQDFGAIQRLPAHHRARLFCEFSD